MRRREGEKVRMAEERRGRGVEEGLKERSGGEEGRLGGTEEGKRRGREVERRGGRGKGRGEVGRRRL